MVPPFNLSSLTRKIPDPRNYYRGVGLASSVDLPLNIICFVRRHPGALTHSSGRQGQHHRHMLIVALEGAGDVCLDAEVFSLRAGQALLVHPFQFHSYAPAQGPMNWVFLTFERTEQAGLECVLPRGVQNLRPVEWAIFEECLRLWVEDVSSPTLLQHCLGTLLQCLQKHHTPTRRSGRPMAGGQMKILAEINRHVMTVIRHPVGLKFLAGKMGRSESNLRKQFRELTGTSLGRHIHDLRIMRACSELHRTALSVGEVAEACGFDSIYSFSRAFKNSMGTSPARYRRALHEGPRT